jgi:hypothetical protein
VPNVDDLSSAIPGMNWSVDVIFLQTAKNSIKVGKLARFKSIFCPLVGISCHENSKPGIAVSMLIFEAYIKNSNPLGCAFRNF